MDLRGWEERYRSGHDADATPTPLLVKAATDLPPNRALDLACGAGRNALWLARRGWQVTAIDGAPSAIEILRRRAGQEHLTIDARVADLERGEYRIEPSAWDLIAMCYYLQRDLFEPAGQGLAPGGILLAIVHLARPGEQQSPTRVRPGELSGYFSGWDILHHYEGEPGDPAHQRPVAEIVVRRGV